MPIATDGNGNALFLDSDGAWKPAQKAVNPETGESLVYDGQTWTPLGQKPDFSSQAAAMDPTDLSIARAKDGPFGDYLRAQASRPQPGETPDQTFKRQYGGLSQEGRPSYAEGVSRSALQGGVFGGGDELVAAGAAALDPVLKGSGGTYGDRYNAYLDRERQRLGQFRNDYPVSAIASEVAGAIPTSMLAPQIRTAQGAGLGTRMLAGGLNAAGQGAAYGFNSGENNADDRMQSAALSAILSGGVGFLAPGAVEVGSRALKAIGDQTIGRMGANNQASVAARKAVEAMMRDGMTPDDAIARVTQMGPDAALMDIGPNTRALAAATARAPGEGKALIDRLVTARQEGTRGADMVLQGGQIGRITSGIDDLIPERFGVTERSGMEAARTAAAEPFYQRSANMADNLIPDEKFAIVKSDPYLAAEFANVKRNPLYGMGDLPDNSMPVVDAVKRSIDDQISASQRTGNNNAARLLMQKKDALIGMADEAFPDYGIARDVWSQYSGVIDAGDLGRKFMRGEVDVVKQAVQAMSPEEAAQFRIGAATALRDRIGNLVNRADATKKLKDIPALEEKIRAAFGDVDTFSKYINMLDNERAMFDTYAAVKSGSQTAERLAADADLAVDPAAGVMAGVDILSNPLSPSAWLRGSKALINNASARTVPEPVRRELAKILAGRNAAQLEKTFQSQTASEASRRNLAKLLTTGAVVSTSRRD